MGSRHVYILSSLLTLLGAGLFLYKILVLGFPIVPGEKSDLWDVEVRISFVARGGPVKVSMYIPRTSPRLAVVDENFISRGFGLTTTLVNGNRQAAWAIRKASGAQALYYRSSVQALEPAEEETIAKKPERQPPPPLEGPYLAAAETLLKSVREQSADLDTMVAQLIKHLWEPHKDSNAALLTGPRPDRDRVAEAALRVLALAQVPARLLQGVRLTLQSGEAAMLSWLQVYAEGRWSSFDLGTGETGLPGDYLVFAIGPERLVKVKGGDKVHYTIAVRRTEAGGLEAAALRGRIVNPRLLEFSLLSLPMQTQSVYRVLLAVPVGAFLLLIMRNVVGIKTFGTFMPVLIGLAFRETQLLWGLVLFCAVVALGLSVRFYFERLQLLLVPRLAAVLIVVVLLMAALSIVSHHLGLERGLSVALFPMVIMTMTIERMSIVWEERGPAEAIQQGLGSLIVAALAYLAMAAAYTEHLMFVFPELLLVLLAGSLLLGKYTGYRLVELRRFKALASPRP
ncbi:MAG: inactive transglutaminase family protein [Chromatiales bacterium]